MEFIGNDCPIPNAVIEEKILSRMKQRTEERAQLSEKRRNNQTNRNTEHENADSFMATFNEMKNKLEEDLVKVDEIDTDEAIEAFDVIVRDLGYIQQFYNESQMFLASVQMKRSQEIINELDAEIKKKMEAVKPKKKFGFRSKPAKAVSKPATPKEIDTTDSAAKSSALDKLLNEHFFGFKDKTDEELSMKAEDIVNRQVNLQNLVRCRVEVLGTPSTIQAANLTDCTVIIGPTMRSAFIKQCRNCTFVLACQQVRIHDTVDTDFYLHVTGAAIIESCHNVGFAPYNLQYSALEEHYAASGLNRESNNWDKVEDFKWINENESSPNMYLILESNRRSDWIR